MQRLIAVWMLVVFSYTAQAQIKNQYKDDKNDNRTVVVKEFGMDDYQILEDEFSDAEVGQVIRIMTSKEKPPKNKREITQPAPQESEREKPKRIIRPVPQKLEQKKPEKIIRPEPQEVEQVKPKKIDRPVSTAPKIKAKRKKRFQPAKRKRYSKHRKYRCFDKW